MTESSGVTSVPGNEIVICMSDCCDRYKHCGTALNHCNNNNNNNNNNNITLLNRVLLEKLTIYQIVKEFTVCSQESITYPYS